MSMAILIAAAGNSSRLGTPKQLVPYQGRVLLQRCIDLCVSLGPDVYCVLGANAAKIRKQVCHPFCHFIYTTQWQDGLSHSIAHGVSQLPEQTTSVMILLADLWALDIDELQHLIECHLRQPEFIHGAQVNDHLSPPIIFPKYCFDALKSLPPGSNGAKSVIKQFKDKVIAVPMPSAFEDLDTPQQLQQLHLMEHA